MIANLLKLTLGFFMLFFSFFSKAQVKDSINIEKAYIPFQAVAEQLEAKHGIKLFYNPQWFEGKSFNAKLVDFPLQEAVDLIRKNSYLSVIKLSETYFVFIPLTAGFSENNLENDLIVVGDMLNYGSNDKVNVKGTIRGFKNKQEIQGAIVVFQEVNKTIATDANGKFNIVLPVGEHTMKVTYPGLNESINKLKVLSDGEIAIDMLEKTINLNEVLITSNRIDQNFRRTQMSAFKIDAKGIKELPTSMGETDVIKSLSLQPGIQTTGEFGTGFNVRGGSSDQNLVLIEDVPVFNTSHLFGLISIMNPDGVSEVTLYKGGIPVIYGERASSVLNVRLGLEDLKKVRVKGGISIINSRLNIEIPITPKMSLMIGGRTTYSDWLLKKMPDVDLMNSSAGFYDLNVLFNYNINKNNKLTLFAYNSTDRFGFSENQKYTYGNMLGSIRYSHHFSGTLYTSIVAGVSRFNSGYTDNDTIKPMESYVLDNSILYRNLKWNLIYEFNDQHVITVGTNAFLYDIKPGKVSSFGVESMVAEKTIQSENGVEWAAFISDDFKMNDKFSCEVGLRYSSFSYLGAKKVWLYDPLLSKTAETVVDSVMYPSGKAIKTYSGLEPRISVQYNFSKSSSVKASYNRINQYVNLVSNTSVITPSDLWKLSDNYVKPLICDQFALGFYNNFKENSYETSVEVYYKPYKNVIEYKNGTKLLLNDHIEADLLNASGKNYGFELYMKKNKGKLTGWVSYTFSRSFRKTNGIFQDEKVNHNNYFPDNLDRPHNLVVNGGYYINRRWRMAFTFNYNTGRPVTLPELKYSANGYQIAYYSDRNKYRMPDYHRLDFSISRFENLRVKRAWKGYWTLSVVNVYARRNAYSIFYKQEQSSYNVSESSFNLYKLYIIGRPLPTLTYNFIF